MGYRQSFRTLLLFLCACPQTKLFGEPVEEKFVVAPSSGVADLGYVFAYDVLAKEELEVTAVESSQLASKHSDFTSSDQWNRVLALVPPEETRNPNEYYKWFLKNRDALIECNETIAADIAEVLDSRKRVTRARQLCNQRLIAFQQYTTVVLLNKLPLSLKQFKLLHCKRIEEFPVDNLQMYSDPAVARYAVIAKRLDRYIGEPADTLGGELCKEVLTGSRISLARLLDSSSEDSTTQLEVLTIPEVQKELGLTISNVAALQEFGKRKMALDGARRRQELSNEAFASDSADLMASFKSKIPTLLNESQQRRFRELLFQRYATELNLSKILRLLGKKEATHEQMRGWFLESNGLQTEAHYLAQSEVLRAGLIRFADAYGARKVRELCGRFVLPRSPYEDTVFQGDGVGASEESVRRDAMRRLNDLPLRRTKNPRRER